MKRLLLPLLLLLLTSVNSQSVETFHELKIQKYNEKTSSWDTTSPETKTDYTVVLNMDNRTLVVTRNFDRLSMRFKDVYTFLTPSGMYQTSGLMVGDEPDDLYHFVGVITMDTLVINLGQLVYTFKIVKQSKRDKT